MNSKKTSTFEYTKDVDCMGHNKLWEILKETGIPVYFTSLLINLCVVQEGTVRSGQGTTDCFKIGIWVPQSCMLSLDLFNVYAEYIMWNDRLDESQTRIKIADRNHNHLRYADVTTLMAESKEELKNLLMKMKEESEKAGLKTQHS